MLSSVDTLSLMNLAAIWAYSTNGWDFVGYVPNDGRAPQVARALTIYSPLIGDNPVRAFYSYATAYPSYSGSWGGVWYQVKVYLKDGRWFDYGHYGIGDVRYAAFALRYLFGDNVQQVVAVDSVGYGYIAAYPTTGYYSYSDSPQRVA